MAPPKLFVKPTTVLVTVKITNPTTRAPMDPTSVTLTSITLGDVPVTISPTAFSKVAVGDYLLSIASSALTPGSYTMLITIVGVDALNHAATTVVTDGFVLSATGL